MGFISWVHMGNYPAGSNPWNGNPLSVDPNYRYFTPAQVPTAEELNFILGNITDAVAQIPESVAKNWQDRADAPAIFGASGYVLNDVSWDPTNSHWVAVGFNSVPDAIVAYSENGHTWTILNFIASHNWLWGGVHGTNGGTLVYDGTGGDMWFVSSAGVATDTTFAVPVVGDTGVVFWFPVASKLIGLAQPNGGGSHSAAFSTPNGTTITDNTAALPATWGTTNNAATVRNWAVNDAGTEALIAMNGDTVITNPSRLLHVTYPASVLTFADLTLPSGILNAHITGLAWNSGLGLWGLLSTNGPSSLWTSPDLITWTLVHAFAVPANGLAVLGNQWCAGVEYTFNGTTIPRVQVSSDGLTWTWATTDASTVATDLYLLRSGSDSLCAAVSGSLVGPVAGWAQISRRL